MPDQDSARVQATEAKPVVWTPEDANRFLTAAIHEANRPLEEQLKRRPLPANWILAIIAFVIFAGCVVALLLSSQLEKTEARAEVINRQREELLTQKVQLEAKSTLLEERLTAASAQVSTLAAGNEELRGAKNDVARFRRQNELLRSQISGLEMEKTALARQLEAVKAMAVEDSLIANGPDETKAAETPEAPEPAKEPEQTIEPIPAPEPEPAAAVKVEEKPAEVIIPAEPEPVAAPEPDPVVAPEPEPAPAEPVAEEPVILEEPAAEEPAGVEPPEDAPAPEPVGEPVIESVEPAEPAAEEPPVLKETAESVSI